MGIKSNPTWATRFNYNWHSNPSMPDSWVFFDKAVLRPKRNWAWQVLTGEIAGDTTEAQAVLEQSAHYKDYLGHTQYTDNPAMMSGRAVQHYTDTLLVNDMSPSDAFADALNLLNSFKGGKWRDQVKDKMIIENRSRLAYTIEGKLSKDKQGIFTGSHSEFQLVCENAASGIREAMAGANKIDGECELFGPIPGCSLQYYGKPDYGLGRCELKTQWDTATDSDTPRANSLPNAIKVPHMTQLAGYWHLSGIVPRIVYSNRLGYRVFEPTHEELTWALNNIITACKRREKLMRVADDVTDLLNLTDPHFADSFAWRDVHPDVLHSAKKQWGLTND